MDKPSFWRDKIPFIKKLYTFYSKINYRGINLWPVMADDVYTYYQNQNRNFWERLRLIIRFIFFRENFRVEESRSKILASYFMSREDHYELMKKSISAFSKEELFFLDAYKHKKNPAKMYKPVIPNLFLLFKVWLNFNKYDLKNTLGKYYWLFIARTYQRYKQIEYFEKIFEKLGPRAYIAFCSSACGEEAIMTLLSNKRSIPTFTMQHGLFPKNFEKFTPISIQSENNVSDFFLLWGKSTYDLQKNYLPKKSLLVVGNPKYSYFKKKSKTFSPKKGIVFMDSTGNGKSNNKMVKLINDFSLKNQKITFELKLHPFDNKRNYMKFITSKRINFSGQNLLATSLLEKCDFIIVHKSSVAYEALLYQIPIFRFKDNQSDDLWEYEDSFETELELRDSFNRLKNRKKYFKLLNFYGEMVKKIFYFEDNKSAAQVNYEEIMKQIKIRSDARSKLSLHNL